MNHSLRNSAWLSLAWARKLKLGSGVVLIAVLMLGYSRAASQNPVFDINIDQQKLLPVLRRVSAASNSACTPPDQSYNIPLGSMDVAGYALPRLNQQAPFFLPFDQAPSGAFYVPLFSDLKTHDMGKFLADITAQGADVAGVCIPEPIFLTRPLWGAADTGPWLHDGRATSLLQAIILHGDTATGSGSEAAPIIDAFEKLSADDQQAVVNFLLSLRLPLEQDHSATAYLHH